MRAVPASLVGGCVAGAVAATTAAIEGAVGAILSCLAGPVPAGGVTHQATTGYRIVGAIAAPAISTARWIMVTYTEFNGCLRNTREGPWILSTGVHYAQNTLAVFKARAAVLIAVADAIPACLAPAAIFRTGSAIIPSRLPAPAVSTTGTTVQGTPVAVLAAFADAVATALPAVLRACVTLFMVVRGVT